MGATSSPREANPCVLLQVFFSVQSENQLWKQLGCNMLFHRFVGLALISEPFSMMRSDSWGAGISTAC